MKAIKAIALILVLGVVIGDLNFHFSEILTKGLNFLFPFDDQYPITIDKCSDNPIYDARQVEVDPTYVSPDSSITIKVAGIMSSDQQVKELNVTTFLNGNLLLPSIEPKQGDVKKGGEYIWSYYSATPGSIETGHWETYMRLQNVNDEELCCIRASWDVPQP